MITNFVKDITELQKGLASESCARKDPFVKLDKDGGAPILNYNIPQSAGFTMYGHQFVNINGSAFDSNAYEVPKNNFFSRNFAKMPESDLFQTFVGTIHSSKAISTLANDSFLKFDWRALEMQVKAEDAPQIKDTNLVNAPSKAQPMAAMVKDSVDAGGIAVSVGTNDKETHSPPDILPPGGRPVLPPEIDSLFWRWKDTIRKGYQPVLTDGFGRFDVKIYALKDPSSKTNETDDDDNVQNDHKAQPYFFVIEEYTTKSYLGDYGAGKTLKTFSLLPGEKTTITVRTYRESNETQSRSENVLDSFTENSAREMESMIEAESGAFSIASVEGVNTVSSSKSSNVSANIGGALTRAIGVGASAGHQRSFEQSATNTSSATRSSNVRSINKALDKHVEQSNASRSIDVVTETKKSETEGEETSIVRELENINKSRVLNFVFRQLLQQYVTITYLSNIKIAFCNGYKESLRVVDVEELDILLEDTIRPHLRAGARRAILRNYLTVNNYQNKPIEFVEFEPFRREATEEPPLVTRARNRLGFTVNTENFWRVKRDATDSWSAGGLEITVPGPILNVATHTLRTSSMVVDAMLGQGEALDSFGLRIQDAAATSDQLENVETLQQVGIIQGIEDPIQRAEMYRKVFGSDCFCDNQNT